MSSSKPYLLVGASVGVICAGVAAVSLLRNPHIAKKVFGGLQPTHPWDRQDRLVDLSSEDSFPASDPPSYSPRSMR